MATKIGDKVFVTAYDPNVDKYVPTEVSVEEVSFLQEYETVRYYNPHIPSDEGWSWGEPIDPNDKPKAPKKGITNGQLAAKYSISLEILREQWIGFVENEGYTGDGEEHETFGDYLDYVYRLRAQSKDPFDGGRSAGAMGQPID